jgi:hypothetical protein
VPEENIVGTGAVVYASWYNPPSEIPSPTSGIEYDPDEAQSFHIRWDRTLHFVH